MWESKLKEAVGRLPDNFASDWQSLTPERQKDLLDTAKLMKEAADEIFAWGKDTLLSGGEIPGCSLVPCAPRTSVSDTGKAYELLKARFNLPLDLYFSACTLSLARLASEADPLFRHVYGMKSSREAIASTVASVLKETEVSPRFTVK